jgi:prepilin-type N-terminal cleavage/methylation domain-containing protein
MKSSKNQKGFTVIELMIATAVFSLVLLICMTSIIEIGRLYYKGLVSARTQDTARQVNDDISGLLRYSSPNINFGTVGSLRSICINNIARYTFWSQAWNAADPLNSKQLETTPTQADQARHALWRDDSPNGACTPCDLTAATPTCTPSTAKGNELLGDHMRLTNFYIAQSPTDNTLWTVKTWVVYGDKDLIDPVLQPDTDGSHTVCKFNLKAGSSFCANSDLTTFTEKRL